MTFHKQDLAEQLEGVVNRLEDLVFDSTQNYEDNELELQENTIDFDDEISEGIENSQAAYLILEKRMDEMTQSLGEEIETLRRILERVEEGD